MHLEDVENLPMESMERSVHQELEDCKQNSVAVRMNWGLKEEHPSGLTLRVVSLVHRLMGHVGTKLLAVTAVRVVYWLLVQQCDQQSPTGGNWLVYQVPVGLGYLECLMNNHLHLGRTTAVNGLKGFPENNSVCYRAK